MDVLITGSGDAFSATRYGSSAVVAAPGGMVMIDCPDPIHRVLREAGRRGSGVFTGLAAESVTDILLTHLHGDHSNGLESLGYYRRIRRLRGWEAHAPRLWCAKETADRIWDKLAPAMSGALGRTLADYFDLQVMAPGQTYGVAGLSIQCRITTHPLHCVGLRVTHPQGGTLGWSGDSAFEQSHMDWLDAASVIVHEAGGVAPAHTEARQLAALPEPQRRKVRLIHVPDDGDTAGLPMVKDGDVLRV